MEDSKVKEIRQQYYVVADHAFCLRIAENDSLWHNLEKAYNPFCIDKLQQKPVFTLTIDDLSPVVSKRTTDKPLLEQIGIEGNTLRYYQKLNCHRFEEYSPEGELNGILLVEDDSDFHKATLYVCNDPAKRKLMTDYGLMLMYILSTISFQTLVVHASVVLNEKKGYLFMGKSGTGKSTHCDLWIKCIPGSERLNDDHPVIRMLGDIPTVFGSPWSGKTSCYRHLSAPIGGFIRLRQAVENSIHRLSPLESYASLATSVAAMTWKPEHADKKDEWIQLLIDKIPCWRLDCLPNEAAAHLCAQTIKGNDSC